MTYAGMTDDELRLEVAKRLGGKWYELNRVYGRVDLFAPPERNGNVISGPRDGAEVAILYPDYPRDIAAAYALEDALPVEKRGNFTTNLWMIVGLHERDTFDVSFWQLIHASAADRCRAWLLTMEA